MTIFGAMKIHEIVLIFYALMACQHILFSRMGTLIKWAVPFNIMLNMVNKWNIFKMHNEKLILPSHYHKSFRFASPIWRYVNWRKFEWCLGGPFGTLLKYDHFITLKRNLFLPVKEEWTTTSKDCDHLIFLLIFYQETLMFFQPNAKYPAMYCYSFSLSRYFY